MDWATWPERPLVVLRGGGDLGSGVAYRLHKVGYPLLITELAAPLLVRRSVAFGSAVLDGQVTVEDITARHAHNLDEARQIIAAGQIPVMVVSGKDGPHEAWRALAPQVVVDVRMAKRNIDTRLDDAPLVIALGPGFTAGQDCHAVIETNRGHWLGRVIWQGPAEPDTGLPGKVKGQQHTRVLRAPAAGQVQPHFQIGDTIKQDDVVATVAGQPVVASFAGVLRGIIHPTVRVWPGLKIGDLDPRGQRAHCFSISDKSLAVGGGVLEAILTRRILPASVERNQLKRE